MVLTGVGIWICLFSLQGKYSSMFSDGSIGDLAIGGFVVFVSDDLSSFKHVLSVCTRVIKSFGLLRFSGSGAVQQTGCTWLLFTTGRPQSSRDLGKRLADVLQPAEV